MPLFWLNLIESIPSFPLGGEKLKFVSTFFYFQSSLPFRWWTGELSIAWQIWERIPVSRASSHFLRCMIFQMLWAALSFHWSLSTETLPNIKAVVLRVLCPGPHMPPLLGFYQPFHIFSHVLRRTLSLTTLMKNKSEVNKKPISILHIREIV